MKQTQFEDRNKELWLQLETQLQIVTGPQLKEKTHTSIKLEQDFPAHYRQICHHLALARSRGYSQALVNRLEQLVLTAH